jgi:hypothetical protein
MVPETPQKKLLFAALLVAAFASGFAIATSMWEGGWGVDASVDIQDEVSSSSS